MGFQTTNSNLDNVVQKFFTDFSASLLGNETPNWQNINAPFSGTNGGGSSIGTNSITLPANQNGLGTMVKRTFDLDPLVASQSVLVGDTIQIRALFIEQFAPWDISPKFHFRLKVNGSEVTVTPTPVATRETSMVQYVFDYVLQANNDLELSFTIDDGFAVNTTTSRTLTWSSIDVYYQVRALNQSIGELTKLNQWPVVSQCVANGTADDTSMLQSEINLAIATSGVLMLKIGTYKITSPIAINGFIRIAGFGWEKTKINAFLSTNLFEINSKETFILEDFRIFRDTGNTLIQSAVKFTSTLVSSGIVNKGSTIRRIKVDTVNGIEVDHCDGFKILDCEFGSVTPIKLGSLSTINIKFIEIDGNSFINSYNSRAIFSTVSNNFTISNNRLINNGSFYSNIFLEFYLKSGNHSNLRIYNNTVEQAKAWAISIVPGEAGANIKGVDISGNIFADASNDANSGGISITAPNSNTGLHNNIIENKKIAVNISSGTRLLCSDNIINGVASSSQAFVLSNCTYMRKANIETGQSVPNSFTGSTVINEV